ncbi:MAG: hypothetical protein M3O46_01550 [Myxococcota bacterium]|nr:hypothetical protein [Myxococcota bacterium]
MNVNGVNGTSTANYGAPTYMSPDALLAYCQMQLGGIDGEIKTQMHSQKLQLDQRKAVEKVQTVLESFGSQGPQNDQMKTCVTAFEDSINSLAKGDPVRSELQRQCEAMKHDYKYDPGGQTTYDDQGTPTGTSSPASVKPENDAWKGTVDGISTLAGDIKSGAEIQMLQLQDLVSQRQQAVQLVSGMMSKEDQTLEGLAKAIGQ